MKPAKRPPSIQALLCPSINSLKEDGFLQASPIPLPFPPQCLFSLADTPIKQVLAYTSVLPYGWGLGGERLKGTKHSYEQGERERGGTTLGKG